MNMLSRSLIPFALLLGLSSCSRLRSSSSADGGATADPAGGGMLGILNGFEGEIGILAKGRMGGKAGSPPQQLTASIKGDRVRLDIPAGMAGTEAMGGGKGWVVYAGSDKKLFIVDDTKKTAMVIDLNKQGTASPPKVPGAPGSGPSKPPPKVTKTGKTDTVAGHKCETWEIDEEGKGKTGEACIANEGFSWFTFPTSQLPGEHAWTAELMDGKHFPLRFIGYENGAENGRIEVTRIDKKTLPQTEFEVPAGYQVMDLSQMMKGMPGGMPGMPSGMPPGLPHSSPGHH